jgi:hypothetical protein
MRDYGRITPMFWTRGTGKAMRGNTDAQLVALYLCSCPNATMVGIYYLPLVTLAHETGLTEQRALAALATCERVGFAYYDVAAELVWVPNMATYQIGETVDPKDKRRGGPLRAELAKLGGHRFTREFWTRYEVAYGLGPCPFTLEQECNPVQSARPGLQSGSSHQDQEQDQDQDQDQEQDPIAAKAAPSLPGVESPQPKRETPVGMTPDWQPTPEHAESVRAKGLHLGRVLESFRGYWIDEKTRKTPANWNRTFATNLRRIAEKDSLRERYRLTEAERTRASWPAIEPTAPGVPELTDAEAQAMLDAAIADLKAHTTPALALAEPDRP